MPDFNENPSTETLVIAFTMVTVSGMATALGAALIFCPCVRPPLAETERGKGGGLKMQPWQKMVLAFSLSLSAGVMTYVSFVEIFQKAVGAFTESGAVSTEDGKDVVYALSTLVFLGGFMLMAAVDHFVGFLSWAMKQCGLKTIEHTHDVEDALAGRACDHDDCPGTSGLGPGAETVELSAHAHDHDHDHGDVGEEDKDGAIAAASQSDDGSSSKGFCGKCCKCFCELLGFSDDEGETDKSRAKLMLSGVMTALAIGIHNFPEGLMTFIGALDSPSTGASLALAIAIHNVPEGICVAFPVFYATAKPGSHNVCGVAKWRGFFWAFVSGVSEPIGATIGYLFFMNFLSDATFAVVFGLVGGMMVFIVVKELLPTAHKYDPTDRVSTLGFFCGMTVMASSLVGFSNVELPSVMVLCILCVVGVIVVAIIVIVHAMVTNDETSKIKFCAMFGKELETTATSDDGASSSKAICEAGCCGDNDAAGANDHAHSHGHSHGHSHRDAEGGEGDSCCVDDQCSKANEEGGAKEVAAAACDGGDGSGHDHDHAEAEAKAPAVEETAAAAAAAAPELVEKASSEP